MAGHVVKMCNSSSTAPVEHRRHTLCSLGGRTGFIILSVQTLRSLQLSLRRASARLWLAILT